jgi:hypothetical protein
VPFTQRYSRLGPPGRNDPELDGVWTQMTTRQVRGRIALRGPPLRFVSPWRSAARTSVRNDKGRRVYLGQNDNEQGETRSRRMPATPPEHRMRNLRLHKRMETEYTIIVSNVLSLVRGSSDRKGNGGVNV